MPRSLGEKEVVSCSRCSDPTSPGMTLSQQETAQESQPCIVCGTIRCMWELMRFMCMNMMDEHGDYDYIRKMTGKQQSKTENRTHTRSTDSPGSSGETPYRPSTVP